MITKGWMKSSYSNGEGGNCVEACGDTADSRVLMRDTQNRNLGYLAASSVEWKAFVEAVRS